MSELNTDILFLIYRYARQYYGLWESNEWRYTKRLFYFQNGYSGVCQLCNKKVNKSDRTIDHIIPREICYELSMPLLVYDQRNLRRTCAKCNNKRGSTINDLPPNVKKRLLMLKEDTPSLVGVLT